MESPVPSAPIASKPDRNSTWALYAGAVAEWSNLGAMTRLVAPILNSGFGINPELVGWAMTLPRVLDAVLDPLVGYLSDRSQTRWGRRRPFVFVGAVMCAMAIASFWWISPHWSQGAQFMYLLLTGLVFWIGFAAFTISLYAMNYELADDYHQRVKFFAVRSVYCQVAGLVVGGWTYWLVLRPVFGGEIVGIRWVSIGLALVILGTGWAPAFWFKERFVVTPKAKAKHSLWRGMREAWNIAPMRQLITIRLLLGFGFAVFNGLYFYVNTYYACGGDKALATKISGIADIVVIVLNFLQVPFVAPLARRLERKTLLLIGVGAHFALGASSAILFIPQMPYLQIAASLFWAPAGFVFGTVCASAVADICDLDELEHGTRREGLFGAAIVFLNKIEVALCTLIPGYVLVLSHFAQTSAQQSNLTLFWLRFCSYVPYSIVGVIALLIAMKYPLNEAIMQKVRTELDLRRNHSVSP